MRAFILRLTPFFIVLTFWFTSAAIAHAATWFEDDVGTSLNTVYGVSFNGATGWVVGRNGFAAKTTDYGKTWTDISNGTSSYYSVIYYGNAMLATGPSGLLADYLSTGWTALTTGTTATLNDVTYYGWEIYAVGNSGTIVHITNAAGDLSTSTSGVTTATLNAVDQSYNSVWAVGTSGTLIHKRATSNSWSTASSGTTVTLNGVAVTSTSATSTETVWICGANNTLKKTTNNGTSWTTIAIPGVSSTATCYDLDFSGDNGLVTIGGGIYSTPDGGTTWTPMTVPSDFGTIMYDVQYSASLAHVSGPTGLYALDLSSPSAPTNFTITEGSVTTDRSIDLSWTAGSDTYSQTSYRLTMEDSGGTETGLTLSGSSTSYTWPSSLDDGNYTFSLKTLDESSNESSAVTDTVMISNVAPTVTISAAATGTVGTSYAVSAVAGDANGVDACELTVPGYGSMDMSFVPLMINWSTSFVPLSSGGVTMTVTCTDETGSEGSSTAYVIFSGTSSGYSTTDDSTSETTTEEEDTVAEEEDTMTSEETTTEDTTAQQTGTGTSTEEESEQAVSDAESGSLVKLACSAGAGVNDPCKAVYFYAAADGKRHAFPNEKVYFTWYTDFDDVLIVTSDFMSSLTLGRNVTYHPGTKMVKFITVNTVYAVTRGGTLRAIESEDVAKSLYGSDWNKQIDDISDAFFGNYDFGEDVDETNDFDPDEEEADVEDIDEDLS